MNNMISEWFDSLREISNRSNLVKISSMRLRKSVSCVTEPVPVVGETRGLLYHSVGNCLDIPLPFMLVAAVGPVSSLIFWYI